MTAYLSRATADIRKSFASCLPVIEDKTRQTNPQLTNVLSRIYQQIKIQPFPDLSDYSGDVDALLNAITEWQSRIDNERKSIDKVAEAAFQNWTNLPPPISKIHCLMLLASSALRAYRGHTHPQTSS